MNYRVSATSSSEAIRALREKGQEPIFTVEESKTLSEILSEIDWSAFVPQQEDDLLFEPTKEPVFFLDADIEEQLRPSGRNRRTMDEELLLPGY